MKILMHMCCGPCSCYPTKKLREIGFEPVGYFFNPNIHPYQEWRRRLRTAREFTEKVNIKFFAENHYGLREFLSKVSSTINIEDSARNADGFHQRCKICYAWRLNEAAKFAAENDFKIFTSTLFYSIHQNHELMKKIAEAAAQRFGVNFYYEDFRAGWQEGIDISLALELYRQNYCGCIFSEEERFSKEIKHLRKNLAAQKK